MLTTHKSSLDESFKASAYSWETLDDPATRFSDEPSEGAFGRAFNTRDTKWEFYDRPIEGYRRDRFAVGMRGIQQIQPQSAILHGS